MGNFRNRGGRGNYRSAFRDSRNARGNSHNYLNPRKRPASFVDPALAADDADAASAPTWQDARVAELKEDALLGFASLPPGTPARVGWLVNMVPATVEEPSSRRPVQAVDLFFLSDDPAGDFRATVIARPYMYLAVRKHALREAEVALRKRFADFVADISVVRLEDTSMPNHLALDARPKFLKLEARTPGDLYRVREALNPIIRRNAERNKKAAAIDAAVVDVLPAAVADPLEALYDMREYDVAPVNRLAIDRKINVGYWYKVKPPGEEGGGDGGSSSAKLGTGDGKYGAASSETVANDVADDEDDDDDARDLDPDLNQTHANDLFSAHLTRLPEIVERANPVVLAYDIECTKKPLKFPDAEAGDEVFMISWMVDGAGYLVINREVVSKDIDDFEFAPHKEYKGSFQVFNEPNERALLSRFFSEVRIAAPRVFVTYNGDYFDWPFVQTRALLLGMDMGREIGMRSSENMHSKETRGRSAVHMDVLHWVNRDSYLPQGSRGLKAVTRSLLGFEPEEIPPEEMLNAAKERPEEMAKYSVSDAVCTYYLYMKYVHPFTFSLCNILPLGPDDVLRKGSGTLCEMLLMCQAREKRIVAPNKYNGTAIGKLTEDGHVLESETYIGGHVEAIRTGIYRSDLPLDFNVDVETLQDLEDTLDDVLKFAITVDGKTELDDITNYDEVRAEIVQQLHALRDKPVRKEKPLIYHLDVSAMYPNIILTNRLQPHAIVSPAQCAACDFNGMSECQRDMEWTWRGEYFPASRGEAEMIQRRTALQEREQQRKQAEEDARREAEFGGGLDQDGNRSWKRRRPEEKPASGPAKKVDLAALANFNDEESRRNPLFRKRLKEYCRVNFGKTQKTREVEKTATVCQRENPFYVDTVRAFRDRRYEYKALLKKQKKAKAEAKESGDEEAIARTDKLVVLYDSLQLAHKCILNSFYGYVMRKGARWYSMEMAGIVTNTGGLIIKRAREFIEKVGLPLELDTDGIWCVLPISFPENFSFKTKSGKKCSMSYICSIFNSDVAANFTNHQYQDLVDPRTFEYNQRSECSIMFEVDGPYKAMVLPASLEEGKSIKKRYAVFNDDGSLAELKGFEIKRRGELKLVKEFQGEIFDCFLKGTTLAECYEAVGATCNKWLDIIINKGEGMTDLQILELLVEQNNMSKPLDEYIVANQKSCAITCATRMRDFLGDDIVKDKGLAATYVISRKPDDAQTTARAIPAKIFEFPNVNVRRRLLRRWTKSSDDDLNLKNLLDWNYYKGRLANAILKIVSIPAALQFVDNPVPRIEYPPWLVKQIREMKDQRKQRTVTSFFSALPKGTKAKMNPFKSLKDANKDTEKLSFDDIEDMPTRNWTSAEMAHRRAKAVVAKKLRTENKYTPTTKSQSKKKYRPPVFTSFAEDPEVRAREMRSEMVRLLLESRPDKRYNYKGWVKFAKRIWREQRAARVHRYALKRRRLGIPDFVSDGSEAQEEEPVEDNPGEKSGEVAPFGGQSFAVRFGTANTRSKRRKLGGVPPVPDYYPRNFVNDLQGATVNSTEFFKVKAVPLVGFDVVWQTISVAPVPEKPGEFKLWVLPQKKVNGKYESGELHCIPLYARRTLYVNSRLDKPPDIPGAACEMVQGYTLPRSQAVHNLFRLEFNEAQFQSTDKDVTTVVKDIGAVDGVFGSQSPLDYEVLVTLGTLCRPNRNVAGHVSSRALLRRGIDLTEITPQSPGDIPYLQDSKNDSDDTLLHQAFLFGSHATDNTSRALYVVVAPQAKLVHVVAVTPRGNLTVNVKRLWRNMVKTLVEKEGEGAEVRANLKLPSDCQFLNTGVRTRDEAWSRLDSILATVRGNSSTSRQTRSGGQKTILLTQWPALDASTATEVLFGARSKKSAKTRNFSAVEECVPLSKSFPMVRLSSNTEDGNYLPVGWESQAITVALGRFADVSNWVSTQLTMSRFAGIPIGNVSSTHLQSQALDVLVGRELMNRDHVLWSSKSAVPDLGGIEDDDCHLQNEIQSVPDMSVPGSYRTVCIDTELSNLAIATILASSHVNQLEGTDMAFDAACTSAVDGKKGKAGAAGNEKKHAAPLDEMASSAPAFRALKDLVAGWDKVANSGGSSDETDVARGLLDHVHRWTRSESSILYDPALARFLGWLVKKVFRQLIGELKNLGANVVYASISRLIIATPKTKTMDGLRYAGFLEKTLKEKALFKHIHFQPLIGVYAGLLFVDRFNYGALPAPEETSILSGEVDELTRNGSSSRVYGVKEIPYVRMMWDMARYLPIPVAVLWTQVVEEFIRRPMVTRVRDDANSAGAEEAERKKRTFRPRGDGFVEEVRQLVRSLTGQLLEKVHEIREKAPTLEFPEVPSTLVGPRAGRRNCALEFVRTLCHVFALDGAAGEEVASMRRNLLQLLGVREFAKEAQFVDPALGVPLHDVICTFCNAVVDLDVARDSRLWAEAGGEAEADDGGGGRCRWACEFCGNPYDLRQIELDLVRRAQKLYTAFQVQDVVCGKCRLVKREHMPAHCACSGAPFALTVPAAAMRRQLFALQSAAKFHRFEFLLETVTWMLDATTAGAADPW